ncbi:MAG TPA: dihydropteroate synthase [Chitinophagaceae bacterium]|nr:dihydropteroate synthase [Chitinophagaceae bacterium]
MPKNTAFTGNYLINCRGRLLDLSRPAIMGILNMTGDSFYSGSRVTDQARLLEISGRMLEEGASILDIGGQSTRPGSLRIDPSEEMARVVPAIQSVHLHFPEAIISIDTYSAAVAREGVDAGASIINDISAGRMDSGMIPLASRLDIPYIAMHMQGTPATMHLEPRYGNVSEEILDFFIGKAEECRAAGIKDLIIDPGFGFGKQLSHNYSLLKHLGLFSILGKPVLAGLSRKSLVYRPISRTADTALNGTTALHMLALIHGANILRVHDVKAATEAIRLYQLYAEQS